jgi:hypothetical protein
MSQEPVYIFKGTGPKSSVANMISYSFIITVVVGTVWYLSLLLLPIEPILFTRLTAPEFLIIGVIMGIVLWYYVLVNLHDMHMESRYGMDFRIYPYKIKMPSYHRRPTWIEYKHIKRAYMSKLWSPDGNYTRVLGFATMDGTGPVFTDEIFGDKEPITRLISALIANGVNIVYIGTFPEDTRSIEFTLDYRGGPTAVLKKVISFQRPK